jgi:hypothetical protein
MTDYSKVVDAEAKVFLQQYLSDREINLEFYRRVPDEQFDFLMVDRPERKSDTPRQGLSHQIEAEYQYLQAAKNGKLQFGVETLDLPTLRQKSKDELLAEAEKLDGELVAFLSDDGRIKRLVEVPWSNWPIPVVAMLWGLDSHEILHQGWNLAIMDHLNIERFPALIAKWGP